MSAEERDVVARPGQPRKMLRKPHSPPEVKVVRLVFEDGTIGYVPALFGENCWGNRGVLCGALRDAPLYGGGLFWKTPEEAMKSWETSEPIESTNSINSEDRLAVPVTVLEDVVAKGLYRYVGQRERERQQ